MSARTAMPRIAPALAGVALALVAGGCASRPGPAAPVGGSPGCPQTLLIHATDGGKSLCVGLGGTVTIDWDGMTEPEADGTALVRDTASQAPHQDAYDAKAKGTVKFTASQRACTPSPGQMACGALIAWNVTVEVK